MTTGDLIFYGHRSEQTNQKAPMASKAVLCCCCYNDNLCFVVVVTTKRVV